MIHHWIQDQIYNICAYIHVLKFFWKRNFPVFKTTLTSYYWMWNHLEFLIDIWCVQIILLISFQTIFAVFFSIKHRVNYFFIYRILKLWLFWNPLQVSVGCTTKISAMWNNKLQTKWSNRCIRFEVSFFSKFWLL